MPTKKPNSKVPKKETKKASKNKKEPKKTKVFIVGKPPCENCLMLSMLAGVESDGQYGLHMHLVCAHAMAVGQAKVDGVFEKAAGEIGAAETPTPQTNKPRDQDVSYI